MTRGKIESATDTKLYAHQVAIVEDDVQVRGSLARN